MAILIHHRSIIPVTVSFLLIAGLACSPESKARSILKKHESEYIECDKKWEKSGKMIDRSLSQLANMDLDGSQGTMDDIRDLQDEADECTNGVRRKILEEKEAAGIPDDVFEKVLDDWIAELQAEGKLHRPSY